MKISLDLEVPLTPNFIRVKLPNGETTTIAIHELSVEQLTAIGKSWTGNLIAEATRKKKLAQAIR